MKCAKCEVEIEPVNRAVAASRTFYADLEQQLVCKGTWTFHEPEPTEADPSPIYDEVEEASIQPASGTESAPPLLKELRNAYLLGKVTSNLIERVDNCIFQPQPSSLTQAGPQKHEKEMLEVIDQRDKWEEKIGDLAALAGCREEWSSVHEHGDCIEEAIHELRAGSNYVADDEIYPRQVNFANGRIVSIAEEDGKTFLRISWAAQSQKGGGE